MSRFWAKQSKLILKWQWLVIHCFHQRTKTIPVDNFYLVWAMPRPKRRWMMIMTTTTTTTKIFLVVQDQMQWTALVNLMFCRSCSCVGLVSRNVKSMWHKIDLRWLLFNLCYSFIIKNRHKLITQSVLNNQRKLLTLFLCKEGFDIVNEAILCFKVQLQL